MISISCGLFFVQLSSTTTLAAGLGVVENDEKENGDNTQTNDLEQGLQRLEEGRRRREIAKSIRLSSTGGGASGRSATTSAVEHQEGGRERTANLLQLLRMRRENKKKLLVQRKASLQEEQEASMACGGKEEEAQEEQEPGKDHDEWNNVYNGKPDDLQQQLLLQENQNAVGPRDTRRLHPEPQQDFTGSEGSTASAEAGRGPPAAGTGSRRRFRVGAGSPLYLEIRRTDHNAGSWTEKHERSRWAFREFGEEQTGRHAGYWIFLLTTTAVRQALTANEEKRGPANQGCEPGQCAPRSATSSTHF
ncbi:unnamed protein product [Amoebophrya sp. A120]|nr:unnamed protein product [Amoebophrya sp. A120]|eukprot:GSA120T00024105001.1